MHTSILAYKHTCIQASMHINIHATMHAFMEQTSPGDVSPPQGVPLSPFFETLLQTALFPTGLGQGGQHL